MLIKIMFSKLIEKKKQKQQGFVRLHPGSTECWQWELGTGNMAETGERSQGRKS